MSYYRDLDLCTECSAFQPLLAIGWLTHTERFRTGPFPGDLLACLGQLRESPQMISMGTHYCDLCSPEANESCDHQQLNSVPGGSNVIIVRGRDGVGYAAPDLIYHYVMEHDYAPPDQFMRALSDRCGRRSEAQVIAATRAHAYTLALRAFYAEVDALARRWPQLSAVPPRLFFHDLRAKTKFGRLMLGVKCVDDVREIVRHRAGGLTVADADTVGAALARAWERFLSRPEFDRDWLDL